MCTVRWTGVQLGGQVCSQVDRCAVRWTGVQLGGQVCS